MVGCAAQLNASSTCGLYRTQNDCILGYLESLQPAGMLVKMSKDFGTTWKVFRYFVEDLANSFPSVSEGPADSIDDFICDSCYSGTEPSTDGEVVLKAMIHTTLLYKVHVSFEDVLFVVLEKILIKM
ncbi:laminin subunit beta-4-like [Carassius gibelio]|uniref:laminin subunit beta-4-like n=1 Tax=Carassius gibelio TaxID=101364 RepID=UPI002279C2D5|nr:laminin subunit beta-4-like [Carassius gibelio]